MAAFTILLHRHGRAESLHIATQLQEAQGLRDYAVPVRSLLPAGASFRQHAQETATALGQTKQLPDEAQVGALTAQHLTCAFGTTPNFGPNHLSVCLTQRGHEWDLTWHTDAQGLTGPALERLITHYETLLDGALADPSVSVQSLPLMTEAEVERLHALTETRTPPSTLGVVELLERQALRSPTNEAVVGPDGSLTYRELDERVTYLARQLRAAGVAQGSLVAVLMQRTPRLYIAMLAVMKAGAAYLPLDATHPAQRLEAVLDDADVALVLTDLPASLPAGVRASAVQIDDAGRARLPAPGDVDLEHPQGEDPAYVIYTSGTTGTPKGVKIPHRALNNLLLHFDAELSLTPRDTVGGVTTVAFDMSILELYLPLVRGARLAMLSRETVTDGYALKEALTAFDVTFMQATPLTWRMLLEAGWQADRRFTAVCGGETTPPDLAEQLKAAVGSVWNLYGPSETTVWSTSHRVQDTTKALPVGRPIANTTLRILDESHALVPLGAPGELYIGGAGIALGYLGRPELTAERFVPDPLLPGAVLYRTGDRARWSDEGELEFLGRLDRQIKLRGYRIELEEIEAVLNHLPGVRHAVADIYESPAGQQQLVAWVDTETSDTDNSHRADQLAEQLRAKLPDYMVPKPIVLTDGLPLSANGKVLRDQLPTPQLSTGPSAAWATSLEQQVAGIWEEILQAPGIGPQDDFFELGGTSLLAQRLAVRIKSDLGVRIRLSQLMKHPTVPSLAAILR
ncbi:amino acid adenylation domain-containing protein [Streptomyces sp. NPDC003023]|uniref:non-ribosomal peptide synthetase n=1 Tax=Streptomyces sp. NPDC003023 TaxID=3364675 RepID=UPI00369CA4E5